ncbi:Gfo/Idh/MocA family oxidoreductase [Streptomyces synnematoformans]|uniref:Gfo/Idh/MocA family oxidoreductase n=1 Tax=Streptomyces synnematoformans TaxID=415721 RepID=A0ABN2X9Y9_9ACTN
MTADDPTRPLRVGLIGLGVISRFYAAALAEVPGVELAAVCDLRDEALAPYRDRVPCHTGHRELLAAGGLDAAVVNVPNDAHAEVCGDLVAAGLPVCVEKPLATRLADGRALVRAARERGVVLFTAFHRRYNANALELLESVPPGVSIESVVVRYLEKIEEHAGADAWYLDADRCGGGCVADNGPNAFDTVRQFLGPVELAGAEVVRDAAGTDRQATVTLTAASGAGGRVELDWSYEGECKDVTLRLTDGSVHSADMLDGYPEFKQSLWHEYRGIVADFARAVRAGEDRAEGGLAALELVAEIYRGEQRPATDPTTTGAAR